MSTKQTAGKDIVLTFKPIDRFLNAITTYRLTLYYLIFLVLCAIGLGALHLISYQPIDIAINSLAAVIACYGFNWLFARMWRASTNAESALITALILTLILPASAGTFWVIVVASGLAMFSKYFLTVERAHIFNPAAVAVVGLALLAPSYAAVWWVGSQYMLLPVLIGGLLLARKVARSQLIWWFLGSYAAVILVGAFIDGVPGTFFHTIWFSLTNSAILFFAFVMLAEPLTMPGRKKSQNAYAALVAVLYATPQLRTVNFSVTPEIALVIGNIFSQFISPKQRFSLPFIQKEQLTADTWLFRFTKPINFNFTAGQYLEWTLPHTPVDSRGNRRYFTISSSPTEDDLKLLVKFYQPSSSYKKALQLLEPSRTITAAALAGDFVLPKNKAKKLAFIAGGVGVAPFRSFARYLIDTNQKRDAVLLCSNKGAGDVLFADELAAAASFGLRTVHTLTDLAATPAGWPGQTGFINAPMISQTVPDYQERIFYISGPQPMVQAVEAELSKLGVSKRRVITDYFPGYSE